MRELYKLKSIELIAEFMNQYDWDKTKATVKELQSRLTEEISLDGNNKQEQDAQINQAQIKRRYIIVNQEAYNNNRRKSLYRW